LPTLLLYEASIISVKVIERRRARDAAAREAESSSAA
jgi:Sec-independent protein secretion pathway component TatC